MPEITRHKNHSLPYSGIVFFLLFAASSFFVSYLTYHRQAEQFREGVADELSAIAKNKVRELTAWRNERLADVGAMSATPLFVTSVRAFLEGDNNADMKKNLQQCLAAYRARFGYEDLCIFDEHGAQRLAVPAGTVLTCPLLDRKFSDYAHAGGPVFLDLHSHGSVRHIHLSVVAPLLDRGRSYGLLVFDIDARRFLFPLINSWPTASRTAETLLVRRDGNDVLFLNNLKFKKNTALNLRFPLTDKNLPAVQAVLGRQGIFAGTDYRGVPVLTAVYPVPDSPWFMVARMDLEEVYEPLRERRLLTVVLTALLVLCAGLGLLVFWRQQRVNFFREQAGTAQLLQAANTELQLLLKSMTNAFVIFDSVFDESGRFVSYRFVYSNPAYERMTGVMNDEVRGKTVHEVWPETEPEWIKRYGEVAVTGISRSFDLYHGPTHKLYHCNVYRPGDTKDRFCVIFDDITERKRAEEDRALRAGISKIFLTSADDDIYDRVLNSILDLLQSRLGVFGYLDESGSLVVPTMTPQAGDKCRVADKPIRFPRETWGDCSWSRSIREKRYTFSNTPSQALPDGCVAVERHLAVPILLRDAVIGLFLVANKDTDYTPDDIAKLQSVADHVAPILSARLSRDRYEQNLEERNLELARLSYTMSHDLKSPLVTIRTFLGYLEKDMRKQDHERIRKDFTFIRAAADKMNRLIEELLDLTRIGRIHSPITSAPLQDIVHDALLIVGGRIAERGITVETTQTPLVLRGDRVRLVEVFQNLIDNAVKFMGDQPRPRIEIGWVGRGDEIHLFVRDNGMGIDPRYQGKLFDLFEQLEPSIEGTGIGLALVKHIVKLHGGRVWVESEGSGTGACFWFTLPGIPVQG